MSKHWTKEYKALAAFKIKQAEAIFEAKAKARAAKSELEAILDQQTLDAAREFWGQR